MTLGLLEIQGRPNLRGLKLIPPEKSPLPYEVTRPQASGPGWGHLWGCYSADQTQKDTLSDPTHRWSLEESQPQKQEVDGGAGGGRRGQGVSVS